MEEPQLEPVLAPQGEKVELSFRVAVPAEAAGTKAMGINPSIDPEGFYIAVFGGSGYFNEWVKATVEEASAHYDGTSATVYSISASLSVSDSRLRLHFIANCPESLRTSPPISGSRDTEEYVLSRIRSQLTDEYNDGYWQKVILPNGVKAILEDEVYVATDATKRQFPNPIVLVRNFARVYLRNLTPIVGVEQLDNAHQLVTIRKFGLSYAPAEGVIAPILSEPYTSNVHGRPISVAEDDESTPLYYENFFINYQRYSITSDNPADTLLTSAPFHYGGYSPDNQSYDYYPAAGHTDRAIPILSDMRVWDDEHPENNVLFVYERSRPTTSHRATRIIIEAERRDQNSTESLDEHSDGIRYYALDIVNTDGVTIPLLRNQTYTVHLLDIEAGSGETDISKAAKAASAAVSGDPDYQDLINVSDGKSSIGVSFTEKFYVKPQTDYVMFRYIPTNITDQYYTANVEGNDLVSIQVGVVNGETGVFSALTPAEAESQGVLAFKTDEDEYKVEIVKDNDENVVPYVRQNNSWVVASASQIADMSVEKWGMIRYQLSESYKDGENYFTQERSQAIQVNGSYNGKTLSRNVILRTAPRQDMRVSCKQKYVFAATNQQETVRIMIPTGLSRSVFPLDFILEPDGYSLTPIGEDLPVDYGSSIVPDNNSPAYYFVKTLTQADYDGLGTIESQGKTWKVFECNFKTTVSDNACTVYVNNSIFISTYAHDNFYNFVPRLFTDGTFSPATVYHNANVSFSFSMDNARSASPVVWWDPDNLLGQSADAATAEAKGLSTSNRVLPPVMTVTLSNLGLQYQADGVTPVTTKLQHYSGNTYLYYTGTGTPTSAMADVSLALVATGAVNETATVTLSTTNISENPNLYTTAVFSSTISGAAFTSLGLSPDPLPLGVGQTTDFSFRYVDGMVEPITISFTNLEPVDLSTGDNALLRLRGDGSYTFTPTDPSDNTYTISVKSTHRYNSGSITLDNEDYETLVATINRAGSIVIPASKLYARGYGDVNPTKLLSNTVTVSATEGSGNAGTCTFSTSTYRNTAAVTIDLSTFDKTSDTTTDVFFRYSNNNRVYKGQCKLDDLMDIIEGASGPVIINLYRWTTEDSYVIDFTNSDNYYDGNGRHSYTDNSSGITATFENCPGEREGALGVYWWYRKDIGTSNGTAGTIAISNGTKTGCKLTGVGFSYYGSYNRRDVYVNDSSIGAGGTSWTSSNTGEGNGETSINVRMNSNSSGLYRVNAIENLTVNYAYWDY